MGDARFDYASMIVKWFDHWLKDEGRGDLDIPTVQYYSIESSKWSSADSWPVPSMDRRFYPSSGGNANTLSGDGKLVDDVPRSKPPDHFMDDPMDPVPTLGWFVFRI